MSKRSPPSGRDGLCGEGPLTPQSSDYDFESDEEKERPHPPGDSNIRNSLPMDLVMPKSPPVRANSAPIQFRTNADGQQQQRASVIMLARRDGTLERTDGNAPRRTAWNYGYFVPPDIPRRHYLDVPVTDKASKEDLPSRKTDGTEMTSGHRDKNIPSRGDVVVSCGDGRKGSHIATSTHVPVFNNNEPTNLITHAKSKSSPPNHLHDSFSFQVLPVSNELLFYFDRPKYSSHSNSSQVTANHDTHSSGTAKSWWTNPLHPFRYSTWTRTNEDEPSRKHQCTPFWKLSVRPSWDFSSSTGSRVA